MAALGAHADEKRSDANHVRNALALLEQALDLVDKSGVSPEIGARLEDVIAGLRSKMD
jgi:hypothetical protein